LPILDPISPIKVWNSARKGENKYNIKVHNVFDNNGGLVDNNKVNTCLQKGSHIKRNLSKNLGDNLKINDKFTLNPIFRCPTDTSQNKCKKLEMKKIVFENNLNDSFSKDDYASIDLDRELLGTKSTKFIWNTDRNKNDHYLSPTTNIKNSPLVRKATGNTDNTKADSVIKMSEKGRKGGSKPNKMFDLESFPSGNIFLTTPEDQEMRPKTRERTLLDIENFEKVPGLGSLAALDRTEKVLKETSEFENSELKQTADFFRPSQRQKSTPKDKFKKNTPKSYNVKMKKIDWNAKLKWSPIKSSKFKFKDLKTSKVSLNNSK
jgi:hypothetical protein